MTETEELIVAAMHVQADRRPDGAAVREALAKTGSRRRGRHMTVIALAAAAVVAIAITVPLALNRGPGTAAPAVDTPVPPNQPAFWQQAMAYQPGWLPADVVEIDRMASSNSILRTWRMPAGSQWPGPMVTIAVYQSDEPLRRTDDTTVIDIDGKPANVDSTGIPPGNRTEVKWQPKPHVQVWINVDGGSKHKEIAVHMAQAMRTDGTKQFRAVVDPGWCPYADMSSTTGGPTLGGHAPEGMASCTTRDQEPLAEVDFFIDHSPGLTKGTKVTARGKQALYTNSKGTQTLSVPVGDGRYLVVSASGAQHPGVVPLTQAEVIKIADTAVVHDAAYVNWIGKR